MMFGVVLWSDNTEMKAVVWCEDQGELAFLGPEPGSDAGANTFESGDLVQFELEMDGAIRRVRGAVIVAEAQFPTLARSLLEVGNDAEVIANAGSDEERPDAGDVRRKGIVLPFIRRRPVQPPVGTAQRSAV
ncbi:hypothetical protein [Pseudooceanicola sp.]|uniref:hypothetical protein n=1 Tax=Pseudooceanicola sp. TaxID=1914328 RepID=UPI002606E495|nr:hypothetical protein [Pseudooceanicola sp.]